MTNGVPGLLILAPPLRVIVGPAPGCPVLLTTCKPAIVPCKALPTFDRGALANTSLSNLAIELVTLRLFCVP
ncbi:hypothetical protein D3C72_2450360 [compost metagenome]